MNCEKNQRKWLKKLKNVIANCRELTRNSQPVRNKNRENTRKKKTITHIRQYLHGSAICLHLWNCRDFTIIKEKIYKCGSIVFQSLKNDNNNKTLITKNGFYILRSGLGLSAQASTPWTKSQKISH